MVAFRVNMGVDPIDYASSGVDIDAEGKAISSLIGALGNSVRKSGQKGAPVPLPVASEELSNLVMLGSCWQLMELAQNYR